MSTAARDLIRKRLLIDIPKPERIKLKLFGMEVELKQPTLREIIEDRQIADMEVRNVSMIVRYVVVPGTDEKVFTPDDAELIGNWPMTGDMVRFQEALFKLTGIMVEEADEALRNDPLEASP